MRKNIIVSWSLRYLRELFLLFGMKCVHYRPQMKLEEGNAFTGVFLLFCWGDGGGAPHLTIIMMQWDMDTPLPLPLDTKHVTYTLPQNTLPSPSTDIWWSSLKTCSNLFIWGPNVYPHWYWHLHAWLASGRYASYWNLSCYELFMLNVQFSVSLNKAMTSYVRAKWR